MKTNLIVPVLALAATAVVSNANATQTSGSGANFQPYNAAEATLIDYLPSGVRTFSSSPMYVIASVDHNPSTTGQTIYIDGFHNGVQTTTCTVFSYSFTGTLLASHAMSASGVSGAWSRTVSLTPAESPSWAYYSVLCYLPASTNGLLYGTAST